jgi:GTP cyclohydrolase IB
MLKEQRFLADVGMRNLPFPLKVASRANNAGQHTVGSISVNAHIMQEFEATWIDRFIQILHQHREIISTKTLKNNIESYRREFRDAPVRIDFEYPFFIEKTTPVTHEKCLVRYLCHYSVKATSVHEPEILFKIDVPVITSYPKSSLLTMDRFFGQLSVVTVEVKSEKDVFPEDLVGIVDKHALMPVYSYLTPEDQDYVIIQIHKASKTSVVMVDEIKKELACSEGVEWYSVRCRNFGMLHSYSTVIGTEKSSWVPFSEYSAELDHEIGL